MAGLIPPEFIDQLLSRVDIVEVIDPRVPLKKAGREYQACCPFHAEKTPSFTVSPHKQFYHCFGCGAHGSAIGFLMEYDHMSFVEAVEELAASAGLDIPKSAGIGNNSAADQAPLYNLLQRASEFFQQQLRRHPQAALAIDYLKQRGLSSRVVSEFGIGFAPPGWNSLITAVGGERSSPALLHKAGLIATAESGRQYDRFRERIMFPITDTRGRVVGFGGRLLGDGKPKYLNSPETPLFRKGETLYGLHEVRRGGSGKQQILVVEGYMDVVALAQFGLHNSVATLGTATTQRHLELLYRTTPRVVFCFDGDRAGRDAAWKALQTALPVMQPGREARFLFLPESEDPDSMVRKEGKQGFLQRVEKSLSLSEFLFQHLAAGIDTTTLDGRAMLADRARPLIEQVPAGTLHELLQQQLSTLTGLEERRQFAQRRPQPCKPPEQLQRSPLRDALRLLLEEPRLASIETLPTTWRDSRVKGIELFTQLFDLCSASPSISSAALIERWPDEKTRHHLAHLATQKLFAPAEGLRDEFIGALRLLGEQHQQQQLHALLQQPFNSLSEEQKKRLKQHYSGRKSNK
jgi:DNA primase